MKISYKDEPSQQSTEKKDWPLIPNGVYHLAISKPKETKSKKGVPGIGMVLKVIAGKYQGRSMYHSVWFVEDGKKGAGMVKHFLKVIDIPLEGDINPEMLANRSFKARVISEEFNGKVSNKLTFDIWHNTDASSPRLQDVIEGEVNDELEF